MVQRTPFCPLPDRWREPSLSPWHCLWRVQEPVWIPETVHRELSSKQYRNQRIVTPPASPRLHDRGRLRIEGFYGRFTETGMGTCSSAQMGSEDLLPGERHPAGTSPARTPSPGSITLIHIRRSPIKTAVGKIRSCMWDCWKSLLAGFPQQRWPTWRKRIRRPAGIQRHPADSLHLYSFQTRWKRNGNGGINLM